MGIRFTHYFSVFYFSVFLFFVFSCQPKRYEKLDDGILIHLPQKTASGVQTVRLQVVSDRIIHVTASAADTFSRAKSLMVVEKQNPSVQWQVKEIGINDKEVKDKNHQLSLHTASLQAIVSLRTGEVTFADSTGHPILREVAGGGKTITPVTLGKESSYRIRQVFESPADEAFYGLGEHQTNLMNYKGHTVDLIQYNSEAVVPFLVSSRNYGILWDNYSITRFGDPHAFESLSCFKLSTKDGKPGGLTATYGSKTQPGKVYLRCIDRQIDYEFLSSLNALPKEFPMNDGLVTWEGFLEPAINGNHQFRLFSSGYIKVWLDGKLLVDRWRESWNPGPTMLSQDLHKGQKYALKIEWIPDSGQSYLSFKWLGPLPEAEQHTLSLASEAGDQIDYYFVQGKSLDDVISGYRQLTGKAQVMPKWAMGLWQSRERYKTQEEILSTVQEFRKRNIPLDNIVLDWSYWKEDQWGSQEFDSSRFPDPTGMIKQLHEQYHTHFMISVWPKFYEGIDNYKLFDEKGWLYQQNIKNRQRDWIGKGYVSTFYDAFNPRARELFWKLLDTKLFSKGVDGWWMDASEPDILSNASIEHRKQLMNPTALGSSTKYFNAYPLVNAQGIYEGQRQSKPDQRVFILTRSAYAGIQRYGAATWSGDIAATWNELGRQIPAGLNFALSGLPYWTTDIGGFFVEDKYDRPEPKGAALEEWRELNTRWYQFGTFCPLFRVHGQYPYREIFNVAPDNHPAYQSMLYYDQLRYRLMPYIYSLAGQTHHQDYTIMRALVMDFAADTAVRNIGDQFMFGPSLLINPVYAHQARSRKLYLPATTGWYDLYSGQSYQGGQHLEAEAPYERIPAFVKEGSIVPFGPDIQYTTEKPADPITLFVYTGKDAQFNLYEDENVNYHYEKGLFSTIPIAYDETLRTLTIGERQGSFPGMLTQRTFRVVWVGKDKAVALNFDAQPDQVIRYSGKAQTIHR